jgi:hypothetical protein
MFGLSEFILLIIIASITMMYMKNANNEVVYMTSTYPGDTYFYLVRNRNDKQKAANLLAYANHNGMKLIEHLYNLHSDKGSIRRLHQRYDPNNLSESSADSGYTSYTVNKGEQVIVCLRDKVTNELIDKNTLMYVFIHEMAHIMTRKVGHIDNFWRNFQFILGEAEKLGIYDRINYEEPGKEQKYCGIEITSNVLNETLGELTEDNNS